MEAFYQAARQLPDAFSKPLCRLPARAAARITEIRLRSGRPLALTAPGGALFLRRDGSAVECPVPGLLTVSHAQLQECFRALCGYSLHSFAACIANGFVPLPGGHRAGVCGTAYTDSDGSFTIRNITSINVRVARATARPPDARLLALLRAPRVGLLIAGEPGSGKTTLLRDAARALSDAGRKTAVVDERFELAPVEQSGFCVDMPLHCDVLSGYPKHIGMQHALRALAPDVLLCDEVGALAEIEAVAEAANAGVGLITTIHARDMDTLRRRPQYAALMRTGAFTAVALLKGRAAPGEIEEVRYVEADL